MKVHALKLRVFAHAFDSNRTAIARGADRGSIEASSSSPASSSSR